MFTLMDWQTDPLLSMRPRRQALWQRLIESAVEVVGEQGYPETTIQDITDHAGISRTQFYFLFEDKEQCFLAAHAAVLAELEARLRTADYSGLDWPDAVRVGVEAFTATLDESPALGRLVLIESMVAGPEAQEQHQQAMSRLLPYIDRGSELVGASRSLPTSIAEMAVGSATAILARELQAPSQPDFARLNAQVHFAILLPYLGPVEAESRALLADDRAEPKLSPEGSR